MDTVRMIVGAEIKAANKKEREILHLISTGATDRAGDIVEPGGADLSNYLSNPIVLLNHDYDASKIIGKATSVTVEDDKIYARTKFRDTDLGREAFGLASEGLGGWSIGFRPIEYDSIQDEKGNKTRGFRFSKWELLEYSLVAVPMNQEVVQNMVQRGLVAPEHLREFVVLPDPPVPTAPEPAKVDPGQVSEINRVLRRLERHNAALYLKDLGEGHENG